MRVVPTKMFHSLVARLIFLLLPTLFLGYFLLWTANQYYSVLGDQTLIQTGYLGLGMLCGAVLYSFRFRFLPPFLLLLLLLYLVYKGIDALSVGEFDTFFYSVRFLIFSVLFVAGWLVGWGFVRLRYFPVLLSAIVLCCSILLLSQQNELFNLVNKEAGLKDYALLFGPAILYCFYIIYISILIRNYEQEGKRVWLPLVKRLVLFLLLAALTLGGVIYFQRADIKETLAEYGGGGKEGKNSMLKKNKDNTFSLKDYTRLRGSLGRSNELLFAAHIDHFFPGTDVPNPLYLTAFYYSKFDTATETFERDSLIPRDDLFEPDPSQISLFSTVTDSSVLADALTEKFRTTVEVEVYKVKLSPKAFVAPSTSFFVQPITVEKDFQKEFRSAYRAKSYISELNSAYFVYNAPVPAIRKFQEQRFAILRSVKNYRGVDPKLMSYYTFMPHDAKFDRIRKLAHQLTKGDTTPVDKIISIRDYFLSKDANGDPLFSYTDNPGIPDIPNASKLLYFLFENHKGYCAYYAGATLFLLRSLGIPSRITVGFMTVDRSSKNKGWYWYYADQAHAWVQVYFPGFGWLDFDTTVGNSDARESPQPDGTPPMQPPKAYLAAVGVITGVDTVHKRADLKMSRIVYHDKEQTTRPPILLHLDLGIASIKKDSTFISLTELHPGDSVTAVSYAQVFKNLKRKDGETIRHLTGRFPDPAPIDEVYVKTHHTEKISTPPTHQQTVQQQNWKIILLTVLLTIALLVALFFLLPRIIFTYYRCRYAVAKTTGKKAYYAYRAAGFYLNQLGYFRKGATALQYARRIDASLGTAFSAFMIPYLKLKYSQTALSEPEITLLRSFFPPWLKTMKKAVGFKKRFSDFWRPLRMFRFFGSD